MIKIGSDFEWFLKKKDVYFPAIGIIDGTKKEPLAISDKGHAIQVDNVLAEGNIPPSDIDNADEFVKNIRFVTNYVDSMLKGSPLHMEFKSSARFIPEMLAHPNALVFGCELTYNAWTGDANIPPNANTNLRTAAFHIHIGYDNPDIETSNNIARLLDLHLGLPSLLIDSDTERRQMYGKAGEVRYPKHGLEYRVLGSHFLKEDALIKWVFETTSNVLKSDYSINFDDADVKYAINNHDVELAKKLMDKYGVLSFV